jgi:hypothetical protein
VVRKERKEKNFNWEKIESEKKKFEKKYFE